MGNGNFDQEHAQRELGLLRNLRSDAETELNRAKERAEEAKAEIDQHVELISAELMSRISLIDTAISGITGLFPESPLAPATIDPDAFKNSETSAQAALMMNAGKWMTVLEITEVALAHGWTTKSATPDAIIRQGLYNLGNKGVISNRKTSVFRKGIRDEQVAFIYEPI